MSGKSRFDLYVPLFHAQIDKIQKKNVINIAISIVHKVFEYSGINVLLQLFRNEILELEHLGNHRDLVLLLYFLASLAETRRFRGTLYSPRLLFLPFLVSFSHSSHATHRRKSLPVLVNAIICRVEAFYVFVNIHIITSAPFSSCRSFLLQISIISLCMSVSLRLYTLYSAVPTFTLLETHFRFLNTGYDDHY